MTPELSEDVDRLACAISESKRLRAQSAVFLDTCRQPGKPGQAVFDLKELSRLWAGHPQHFAVGVSEIARRKIQPPCISQVGM